VIVYFAGVGYDGVAGTDRHVADALSAMTPVLYVDPPRSALTPLIHPHLAESLRGPALREVRPGLWRLIPRVAPGAGRPGIRWLTATLVRRAVRRAVAELGQSVSAVITVGPDDVSDVAPQARSLFYATDDLVAGAVLLGLSPRRLRAGLRRQLKNADRIAVVSPILQRQFATMGREAALIPNGCAPEAYGDVDTAPWPEDVPSEFPDTGKGVAGFVGNINGRIDIELLEAVAAAGHPLLLVGPREASYEPVRFPALVALPNVCWVGRKPFADLPSYLRVIDVGLTPYVVDDFNLASFPIKTLEYLAVGRGVVSTDLPATDWLRADEGGADLIGIATTPAEFVAAVEDELTMERTHTLAAERRRFAARHDWAVRARAVAELLGIQQEVGGP
jgi:teichuronic acid biosynthesis glycosyltransferase TuaH